MKPISVRELVEVHHALLSLSNVQTCLWYCVAKNLGKTKMPELRIFYFVL